MFEIEQTGSLTTVTGPEGTVDDVKDRDAVAVVGAVAGVVEEAAVAGGRVPDASPDHT